MNRNLLSEVLSRRPSGPLYHYTQQTGFMGIIRSKEIWATHTQYLNDLREYLHTVDLVRFQIQAIRAFGDPKLHHILRDMESSLDGIETMNVCVCSFSEERDSLSQWRAYGASSSGFSIGFSGDFIREAADRNNWFFAPCIYDPIEQSKVVSNLVQEVIEENVARKSAGQTAKVPLPPGGNLNAYLHRYAPILKDYAFKDEKEWRLISLPLSCEMKGFGFREGNSMLVPYYKFPLAEANGNFCLHEVVVGPTPHSEQARRSAYSFLASCHHSNVPVDLSGVPYRSW